MAKENIEKMNAEAAAVREQRDADYAAYEQAGRVKGLIPRERFARITFPRVSREIREKFLSIPDMTSTVSDALDILGVNTSISAARFTAVIPDSKLCGSAYTIRNLPTQKTYAQYAAEKAFIPSNKEHYLCEEGDIAVYDFGGETDISCIGGNGCILCKNNGFAGSIIYGACRDIPVIRNAGFPVFCAGATQISGKYRLECIEINGPVTVFGKRCNAGDLIMADESGICIVPYDMVEQVLELCFK